MTTVEGPPLSRVESSWSLEDGGGSISMTRLLEPIGGHGDNFEVLSLVYTTSNGKPFDLPSFLPNWTGLSYTGDKESAWPVVEFSHTHQWEIFFSRLRTRVDLLEFFHAIGHARFFSETMSFDEQENIRFKRLSRGLKSHNTRDIVDEATRIACQHDEDIELVGWEENAWNWAIREIIDLRRIDGDLFPGLTKISMERHRENFLKRFEELLDGNSMFGNQNAEVI